MKQRTSISSGSLSMALGLTLLAGYAFGRYHISRTHFPIIPVASTDSYPSSPANNLPTALGHPREPAGESLRHPLPPDSPLFQRMPWLNLLDTMSSDQLFEALHNPSLTKSAAETIAARSLLLLKLAEVDPQRAVGYASTLRGHERLAAEQIAFAAWAHTNPNDAAAYLHSHVDSLGILTTGQRQAVETVSKQWAEQNPQAALEWARLLPPEVRTDAMLPALAALAQSHPNDAIAAVNAADPATPRQELIETLIRERARVAPQETAGWLQGFQNPADLQNATRALVNTWSSQNSAGAESWIHSLDPGIARDTAIQTLLNSPTLRTQPQDGLRWIHSITDETIRASTLNLLRARWEILDPAAAAAAGVVAADSNQATP